MTYGRIVRTLALACLLTFAVRLASNAAAPTTQRQDGFARADASAMRTAAAALDRAAAKRKAPRNSFASGLPPALGAWLQAGLANARKEKKVSNRAADLRALAASLRMGAELADRRSFAPPAHLSADVKQVLAEPAFRVNANVATSKKPEQSWLGRVLQAIADWWARVMFRLIGAAAGSPEHVFRTSTEPFVAPSGGRMDEIVLAVRDCPSGALSLAFDGDEARDLADWHGQREAAIEVTQDGPYRVTGGVGLTDATGADVRSLPITREHRERRPRR